jgi:hypothetical protein
VLVPRKTVLHFKSNRIEARDPELKQMAFGTRYAWRFENVPALVDDALTAPDHQRALLLSTFPDWSAFAGWYGRISRETDKMSPEITAQVTALTRDAETDQEKLLALYNYVTGLRYVAVPLGVNSVRPHAAANVFRNQFGDCKDKANLLNTMLRSIGIEAHLVLVPRFSQAYDAVPGLAFNHAISRVVLGDEIRWLDTTDGVCRFGMLPPGDPGRKVLVIDGKSTSLTELPEAKADDHVLELRGQLDCSDPSLSLPASLAVTSSGIADYGLRSNAQHIASGQSTRPLLASIYRPSTGVFALGRQSFTAAADLSASFEWHGEGRCVGLVTRSGSNYRVRVPFWIPRAWDTVLNARQAPLFIHQGYPLKLEQEFDVTLPAAVQNLVLPAASAGVRDPFHWQLKWSLHAGGKVKAKLTTKLLRGELSSDDTPVLQAQLQKLFESMVGEVRFSLTPE